MPGIRKILWLAVLSITLRLMGQVPPTEPGWVGDFEFVVQTIEKNYAGFGDKVPPDLRSDYDALTAATREAVAKAATSELAVQATRSWLDFFRDKHVGLVVKAAAESVPVNAARVEVPTEAVWREAWEQQPGEDPIEGIWDVDRGLYRLGVRREGDFFVATVLSTQSRNWSAGQIKFTVQARDGGGYGGPFWNGRHQKMDTTFRLAGKGTYLVSREVGGRWHREFPEPVEYLPEDYGERLDGSEAFFLRALSATTLWLRLSDFLIENRAELEALLKENADLLATTPNLLIDLRHNGGGDDSTYREVMRLLYTRPIIAVGVEHRATPLNRARLRSFAADPLYENERDYLLQMEAQMAAAAEGEFIRFDDGFYIKTYPEVKPFPKRVGILITGAASSGEQFVLQAMQSRKVTLFGGRTAGVLDYANVNQVDTPSGRWSLAYATSRSLRLPDYPVDAVGGIPPDIAIAEDEEDPIAVVQAWLERQVD